MFAWNDDFIGGDCEIIGTIEMLMRMMDGIRKHLISIKFFSKKDLLKFLKLLFCKSSLIIKKKPDLPHFYNQENAVTLKSRFNREVIKQLYSDL